MVLEPRFFPVAILLGSQGKDTARWKETQYLPPPLGTPSLLMVPDVFLGFCAHYFLWHFGFCLLERKGGSFFLCDLKFMGCFISRMPIVGKIFSCNDLLSIGRTHLDLVTSELDRVLHNRGREESEYVCTYRNIGN